MPKCPSSIQLGYDKRNSYSYLVIRNIKDAPDDASKYEVYENPGPSYSTLDVFFSLLYILHIANLTKTPPQVNLSHHRIWSQKYIFVLFNILIKITFSLTSTLDIQ